MSHIVVKHLNFLEELDDLDESEVSISGGAWTNTSGFAWSGHNFAHADVNAIAFGETTYTSAQTNTSISHSSFSTTSHAEANGFAFASSGNATSSSNSHYSSTSYNINYSHY